jgi:hypothetical protein
MAIDAGVSVKVFDVLTTPEGCIRLKLFMILLIFFTKVSFLSSHEIPSSNLEIIAED